jgi:hypothetical protein
MGPVESSTNFDHAQLHIAIIYDYKSYIVKRF